MDIERWKDVPGYEGRYLVSDQGRIKSQEGFITRKNGVVCRKPARVMRPGSGKSQYQSLRLRDADGVYLTHYVHTLVLEAFVCQRPAGMDACHCDGNRKNNKLSNLRWDSRAANHADKKVHGTGTIGERHPMARLSNADVVAIRRRRAEGASATDLANEFNVSRMTAFRAATGRSWSHLS